jgi:hypothetical protein
MRLRPHKVFAEFLAIYVVFLIQTCKKRENILLSLILYFIFVSTADDILSNHIRDLNDIEYCVNYFLRTVDTSTYMGSSLCICCTQMATMLCI